MAFESLTERLQGVFKNLRRKGKLSEKEVQEVTKEIRLALLEADVALPVVKTFIKRVRERAVGHEIIDTLDASQQIIKIVNEELTDILGSETSEIEKSPKIPTIIMMVGLQGAGKTTFAGKLANKLIKEQEARPMMIAADIYRPAAIDQLKTLGQQINVPVFDMGTETPAVEIVKNGLEQARANKNDYVLIDTAGRLQIDETLMQELHDIKDFAHPNEILLVVDSMIGQEAANVAKEFNEQLDITGVVLTKIDGDTRVVRLFQFVRLLVSQLNLRVLVRKLRISRLSTQTVCQVVFWVWVTSLPLSKKLLKSMMRKNLLSWLKRCVKTPLTSMTSSTN